MTEQYRQGNHDVHLPANTPPNQYRQLIEAAIEQHLAQTNEWPKSVDYGPFYPTDDGMLTFPVTYETGPHGIRVRNW